MNSSSVFFTDPFTDSQERPQDLARIVIGGGRPLPPKIRSNLSGCSIDCFFFFCFFFAKILPDNKNEVGDEFDESFWVFFVLDLFV